MTITPGRVTRLARDAGAPPLFRAELLDGTGIVAQQVVVAIGFQYFAHVPDDLAARLSTARSEHTCTAVDLERLAGRRCLIVGGRQSAFEWAALAAEAGAASVDVSYRHDTPRFTQSDWLWADALVQRFVDEPGWYAGSSRKSAMRWPFGSGKRGA